MFIIYTLIIIFFGFFFGLGFSLFDRLENFIDFKIFSHKRDEFIKQYKVQERGDFIDE